MPRGHTAHPRIVSCRTLGLIALGLAQQVDAWCTAGHEHIGRIAEGLLHGKHRDQIRSLMHADPEDAANFQAAMLAKYPGTVGLQFHRQGPEWTCMSSGGLGVGGQLRCDASTDQSSLFCAAAYFFDQFAHDALLKEFDPPEVPIGMTQKPRLLSEVPSSELQPSHLLRWLMVLIADFHQPLHWQRQWDYGREVEVKFRGEKFTLHEFWEDYLPKHLLGPRPSNEGSKSLDKDYQRRAQTWGHRLPTDLFRDWAREVAEKLCTEVYAPIQSHAGNGEYTVPKGFEITEELFNKWAALAEDLLTTAGEHLAYVFNEIIEHKRHKDASNDGRGLPSKQAVVGAQVADKPLVVPAQGAKPSSVAAASSVDSKNSAPTQRKVAARQLVVVQRASYRWHFVWNLGIAAFVVPALLLSFSWHLRIGGGSLLRLGKEHLKL
mmetsp:Transcript_13151/g.24246  ORF Transcript_13151/g.24246 Transcript_13151/m.24246 type:complete len:434 (+) Transcript_13151:39-1340(+)